MVPQLGQICTLPIPDLFSLEVGGVYLGLFDGFWFLVRVVSLTSGIWTAICETLGRSSEMDRYKYIDSLFECLQVGLIWRQTVSGHCDSTKATRKQALNV